LLKDESSADVQRSVTARVCAGWQKFNELSQVETERYHFFETDTDIFKKILPIFGNSIQFNLSLFHHNALEFTQVGNSERHKMVIYCTFSIIITHTFRCTPEIAGVSYF